VHKSKFKIEKKPNQWKNYMIKIHLSRKVRHFLKKTCQELPLARRREPLLKNIIRSAGPRAFFKCGESVGFS